LLPLSALAESQVRLVRRCPSSPHQALLSTFCESARVSALRQNFDRERIAQTETKEVDGTIRRKHSDE
jgi:hypothetical protein